jgi:hypothetical protein
MLSCCGTPFYFPRVVHDKLVIIEICDICKQPTNKNSATDEFGRELCYLLGDRTASKVCVRTGNANAADQSLAIPFSNDSEFIKTRKIVL